MEKVLLQDIHFEGRTGFRCDEKQRSPKIDCAFHREDLSGIGRVNDVQMWIALATANDLAHHLWRETRAAHSEQDDVVDTAGPHFVCESGDRGDAAPLLHRQRQPAEPSVLIGTRPDRGVAIPDAAHDLLLAIVGEALTYFVGESLGRTPRQIDCRHVSTRVPGRADAAIAIS